MVCEEADLHCIYPIDCRMKVGLREGMSIHAFDVLKDFPTTCVYLYAGAYTNELIAQIRSLQPTVDVVVL